MESSQELTPTTGLPDGQGTYETNGQVALPGDTGQLYYKFVGDAVLNGFVVDEGGELQKIIAGNQNITAGPDGNWKWGQSIPNGAYCIAIVKNVTKDTKTLQGAFLATVSGVQGGPAPGSLTSPHASGVNAGGHASPRAPGGGSATVTPGSNEVAVLLPYGEAKRILDIVNGAQQPLSDSERAGVVRAFMHAFQRSGMG